MKQLNKSLKKVISVIDQRIYPNRDFVIVSNNCWGAEIYKRLNKAYNTPFIGLYLYGPDYLKLLQNFDSYLNSDLQFIEKSKWTTDSLDYPIGILNDVEVHFMHYKDKEEAYTKWSRRLKRMKETSSEKDYYFKICDRDYANFEIISAFHKLPFPNKLSFGVEDLDIDNHIKIEETKNKNKLPDGVKLYRVSHKYIDVLEWVNSGITTKNTYSKLKYLLKLV